MQGAFILSKIIKFPSGDLGAIQLVNESSNYLAKHYFFTLIIIFQGKTAIIYFPQRKQSTSLQYKCAVHLDSLLLYSLQFDRLLQRLVRL